MADHGDAPGSGEAEGRPGGGPDGQSDNRPDDQPDERPDAPPDDQPDDRPDAPSDDRPDDRPDEQRDDEQGDRPADQAEDRPSGQALGQTADQPADEADEAGRAAEVASDDGPIALDVPPPGWPGPRPGPETKSLRPARAGRFGAFVRAAWEELNSPRARLRAMLRRAVHRMRRRPAAAAVCWGALAGAAFILFALGVGAAKGLLAWCAFAASLAGLAVGAPLALVYAWPLAVALAVAPCAWAAAELGAGALWLGAAVCAGALALYFAASELVPPVAGAVLAYVAWESAGESGAAPVWAAVAFVGTTAALVALRRKVTAPVLAGGWTFLSGAVAANVAWHVLGDAVPVGWQAGYVPGPPGLWACVAVASVAAAALAWPRKTRAKRPRRRDPSITWIFRSHPRP